MRLMGNAKNAISHLPYLSHRSHFLQNFGRGVIEFLPDSQLLTVTVTGKRNGRRYRSCRSYRIGANPIIPIFPIFPISPISPIKPAKS